MLNTGHSLAHRQDGERHNHDEAEQRTHQQVNPVFIRFAHVASNVLKQGGRTRPGFSVLLVDQLLDLFGGLNDHLTDGRHLLANLEVFGDILGTYQRRLGLSELVFNG